MTNTICVQFQSIILITGTWHPSPYYRLLRRIDINLKEYRSWVCGQNLALFIYIYPSSKITE